MKIATSYVCLCLSACSVETSPEGRDTASSVQDNASKLGDNKPNEKRVAVRCVGKIVTSGIHYDIMGENPRRMPETTENVTAEYILDSENNSVLTPDGLEYFPKCGSRMKCQTTVTKNYAKISGLQKDDGVFTIIYDESFDLNRMSGELKERRQMLLNLDIRPQSKTDWVSTLQCKKMSLPNLPEPKI